MKTKKYIYGVLVSIVFVVAACTCIFFGTDVFNNANENTQSTINAEILNQNNPLQEDEILENTKYVDSAYNIGLNVVNKMNKYEENEFFHLHEQ